MDDDNRAKMMDSLHGANNRSWAHIPATLQPTPQPPVSASTLTESQERDS